MRITVSIASVALKRFSSFIFNAETVFFLQRVPATTAEEKKERKRDFFFDFYNCVFSLVFMAIGNVVAHGFLRYDLRGRVRIDCSAIRTLLPWLLMTRLSSTLCT